MNLPTPEQLATLKANPTDHITLDYQRMLRRLGRASFYFFSKYLFGRTGLNDRAHHALSQFVQKVIVTPNGFGVAEDPRGTGKSWAITIPGPAWCLIQDPKECKARGWLPLGPEASIVVASYKTPFAANFVEATKNEMERNDLFLWLFGDLIPDFAGVKGATWSKEMFTVVRKGGVGPSVQAIGTESGSTSLHPVVVFIDDLINEINYKSAAEIASQVEWVEHSENLVEITRGSRIITQNEWSERGVNAALRRKNVTNPRSVSFFSRGRIVCDLCEKGRLLDKFGNPEECNHTDPGTDLSLPRRPILDTYLREPDRPYTMEDIERLKASLPRAIWYAQHENNPLAQAEMKWRESWLRYYTINMASDTLAARILSGAGPATVAGPTDPSRYIDTPVANMHVVVGLDPGLHRPAIVAAGLARVPAFGDVSFILDASSDALSPRDQFFLMFDLVRRWQARTLVYESVGLQDYIFNTIPVMAEAYERERGIKLPYWITRPNRESGRIIGSKVYKREGDKLTRIDAAISPFAEQRLIAVRRDISAFIDEYVKFDKGINFDVLDCFAMIIKAWKAQRPVTVDEAISIASQASIDRARFEDAASGAAGYGEGV